MKRVVVIGIVVAASVVSFAIGAGLALQFAGDAASHRLALSRAHWTTTLNDEVKVGESKADVQAWMDRTVARPPVGGYSFDADKRTFFVIVDDIQEPISFPCSDWYLGIEISLGPDDRVTSQKVTSDGACV